MVHPLYPYSYPCLYLYLYLAKTLYLYPVDLVRDLFYLLEILDLVVGDIDSFDLEMSLYLTPKV